MTEDPRLSRAAILIRQKKYAEADKILSTLLAENPNQVQVLALLAEVHLQQEKFESANSLIDSAIGLSPDYAHLYYTKSYTAIQETKMEEAEEAIRRAIELDPRDADYFALYANIRLERKSFQEALELANHALEIDAENIPALNARSTALVKLGQKKASFETIEGALREDPNNAYTHANYGWGLLEKGDHKKAMEHFKEALTQDPTLGFAQSGMLEALKASNPVYRLFLKYAFWMGNLTARYQWGVIIGFFLAFRGLRVISDSNEALKPYLTPILFLLAAIAFSTWVITPISNLFLRLSPYGQVLLGKKEKISANCVAVSLGVCLIGLLLYVVLSDDRMLVLAAYGFAMMVPLGYMFSPSRNKYGLLIYTIALGAMGLIGWVMTLLGGEIFNPMVSLFILGFVAYQWITNYFLIKGDNK